MTALITALVLAVICSHIWYGAYTGQSLRFADNNMAMFTAADGFFYLAEAERYLAQGGSVPALAMITALIQKLTGFELTNIAFWLPVFFTFLLCFVYGAWAVLLGFPPLVSALAVIFGTFVPAWIERSRMGWFDTDTGIAFLWQACLVSVAFIALPGRRFSLQAFIYMLISGGLLAWLWKPGAILLPICFALWGISFLWEKNKTEKRLRLIVFLGMLFAGLATIIAFFFAPDPFGTQLRNLYAYALGHFSLVTSATGDVILNSIMEIVSIPLDKTLIVIGGSPWGGLFALASLGLFCIFQRYAALFLLPALIMFFLGFVAERFIYLGAVPIGLSIAWLTHRLWLLAKSNDWGIFSKLSPIFSKLSPIFSKLPPIFSKLPSIFSKLPPIFTAWKQWKIFTFFNARFSAIFSFRLIIFRFMAVSLVAIIFFSQAHWFFNWLPEGYFLNEHDQVALALRHEAPPNSPVWAWWDDGYFLRARAGLYPMFDGGSQNPYTAAVVARPFMTEDTRFSSRWIRFFALRGITALNPLVSAWGGQDKTWELVEKIFSADQPEAILATLPPVKINEGGAKDWLFPKGRVFIYFSQRILRISKWWGSIGLHGYPTQAQLKTPIDALERGEFHYNPVTNFLRLPDVAIKRGYTALSAVYMTDQKPIMAPWPTYEGLFAVVSPHSKWLYMASTTGLKSLPLRLMAPAGVPLDGFRLIDADYNYAGAWEVLP